MFSNTPLGEKWYQFPMGMVTNNILCCVSIIMNRCSFVKKLIPSLLLHIQLNLANKLPRCKH